MVLAGVYRCIAERPAAVNGSIVHTGYELSAQLQTVLVHLRKLLTFWSLLVENSGPDISGQAKR